MSDKKIKDTHAYAQREKERKRELTVKIQA